jgi:hypothetical protein
MRSPRVLVITGLLTGSVMGHLHAQAMLSIRERAPDGDTALAIGKSGIVDINGTLLIKVHRDSIRQLAVARVSSASAISELLGRLDALVRVRDTALAQVGPALAAWSSSAKDSAAIAALHKSLHPTLAIAQQVIKAAPLGTRLRTRLNAALRPFIEGQSGGVEELYRLVFAVAVEEADALRLERDSLLKAAGVFVQVGGWSVTAKGARPLHFDGFDENPNLEDFEVERFGLGVIALSEEQKRELATAGETARTFNEQGVTAGLPDLSSGIRSAIGEAVLPVIDEATACVDQIRAQAGQLIALPGALAASAQQQVDAALRPLQDLRTSIVALKDKYSSDQAAAGQSTAQFLIATNDDLAGLYRKTESAKTALITLQGALAAVPGGASAEGSKRLATLRTRARACGDSLQVKLAAARASGDALLENLLAVRQINADILAFSESVFRLDIDRIPEAIEFRLRYSGERRDGDRLLVRALLGTAGDRAPAREDHELTMFRIQLHLETVVGLIFADPLGSSQVTGRFQAGPSYSVLLKRGSRRSTARNRFLLIGAGLNIAALDFNHDDTPELAVGGVISLLGDYVQGGIGYNIPRDRGYWFFGLRLPVPTFTLPGAGGVDTAD